MSADFGVDTCRVQPKVCGSFDDGAERHTVYAYFLHAVRFV